jgi:feruloyl esterase
VDGIIQDDRNFVTPSSSGAVNVNPEVLKQAGLTDAQIAAFDLIASWIPFTAPSEPSIAGGLYPAFAISRVDQWAFWMFGTAPPVPNSPTPWTFGSPSAPLAYDVISSMMQAIFPQNPDWIHTVDFTSPTLQQQFDQFDGVQGPPANYNEFRNQGGKVLFYVGVGDTADEYLGDVIDYYQMLQYEFQDLGKNPTALQNGDALMSLQSWAREFLVPAWGHCSPAGGPGPDGSGTGPSSQDVPNQALNAMIAWVEHGTAPDSLVAANSTTGRTFRLCPEPETAVFNGGDVNNALNWTCRTQRDFLQLKWIPGTTAK